MRAVGNAPWKHDRSGFAPATQAVFRRPGPRYSHGPTVLKRRARSLLGVLRAPLLRRQPSIPLSPACCHGHLECVRRASRGPSRQVSLAERGRGWPHKLAEAFILPPSREGGRFARRPGCFLPIVPSACGGRPLCVLARSLRHAAPEGHCERETSAFCTTSKRLALTSQASRSSSVGGVRGVILVGRPLQRPFGFYDAYSLAD
jgi:hypothetical protein